MCVLALHSRVTDLSVCALWSLLSFFQLNWAHHVLLSFSSAFCCMQAAPFFDRLVFSKVKQRLGGNVKLIVSGGAPLAPHVEEFLKVAMCSPVVQVRRSWAGCSATLNFRALTWYLQAWK